MKKTKPKLTLKEIERKLFPRLHKLGYVLIFFGVISFFYALFAKAYISPGDSDFEEQELTSGISEESNVPPFEISEGNRINLYAVSAVFLLIGGSCVIGA